MNAAASPARLLRLGLLGGSFDPVHLGHLLVAQTAQEELGLDRVFFIPAARSPFKLNQEHAPAPQRLRLLRLALAGRSGWVVDDQEIRRGGVSYTVETLRELSRRFVGAELYYLLGADNVPHLPEWRAADELAALAVFVAVLRPGESPPVFPRPFRGRVLSGFPLGVSSSQIRARVRAGLPIAGLVPDAVAEAIHHSRLYL